MKDLVSWVIFLGTIFLVFMQLYAWASFLAFTLLIIMLREINSNLVVLTSEIQNINRK